MTSALFYCVILVVDETLSRNGSLLQVPQVSADIGRSALDTARWNLLTSCSLCSSSVTNSNYLIGHQLCKASPLQIALKWLFMNFSLRDLLPPRSFLRSLSRLQRADTLEQHLYWNALCSPAEMPPLHPKSHHLSGWNKVMNLQEPAVGLVYVTTKFSWTESHYQYSVLIRRGQP